MMCENHPDVASFVGMNVSRRIAEAWHCEMLHDVIAKCADLTEAEIPGLKGSWREIQDYLYATGSESPKQGQEKLLLMAQPSFRDPSILKMVIPWHYHQ